MVLPENQFNCKQIQGERYTKIYRIMYVNEINHKKACSQNFTENIFYKISYWFHSNIYMITKVVKNNFIRRLNQI